MKPKHSISSSSGAMQWANTWSEHISGTVHYYDQTTRAVLSMSFNTEQSLIHVRQDAIRHSFSKSRTVTFHSLKAAVPKLSRSLGSCCKSLQRRGKASDAKSKKRDTSNSHGKDAILGSRWIVAFRLPFGVRESFIHLFNYGNCVVNCCWEVVYKYTYSIIILILLLPIGSTDVAK